MTSFGRPRLEFRRNAGLSRRTGWAVAAVIVLLPAIAAHAQSLGQGVSAFQRQDYVTVSRVFIPLAERGNAGRSPISASCSRPAAACHRTTRKLRCG